jgi:hypothetical protein
MPDSDLELIVLTKGGVGMLEVGYRAGGVELGVILFLYHFLLLIKLIVLEHPPHFRINKFFFLFFCLILSELFVEVLDALPENVLEIDVLNL